MFIWLLEYCVILYLTDYTNPEKSNSVKDSKFSVVKKKVSDFNQFFEAKCFLVKHYLLSGIVFIFFLTGQPRQPKNSPSKEHADDNLPETFIPYVYIYFLMISEVTLEY